MTTSYTIRRAVQADVRGAASLCVEVNPLQSTGELQSDEYYERFFSGALKSEEALLLAAESEGRIVGFAYAVIENSPDDCAEAPYVSFDLLGVASGHRGKGIAGALAEGVESWSQSRGIKLIQLAVGEANTSALALYERLGYRTVMRKMQKSLKP